MSFWPNEEEGRIATKNKTGFMFTEIDGASANFQEDCKKFKGKVVDIGSAYGVNTLPILQNTENDIIAIDLSSEHLSILQQSVPEDKLSRLRTVAGEFPFCIEFDENSIDAMHSCFVFHFINGDNTLLALQKIYHALKPGGKFYLNTASIYINFVHSLLPQYEENVKKGITYPGEIYNLREVCPPEDLPYCPDFFHVYKKEDLANLITRVGFNIDEIYYYDVKKPTLLHSDGKGVIAAVMSKLS